MQLNLQIQQITSPHERSATDKNRNKVRKFLITEVYY